jgi:putative Mg2+ transporter-C (MgtC) family protein
MPLTLTWNAIALRLGLSLLAGFLIGINRSEHGRPAGLRTNILVCLAAAIAMIQVNLLLPIAGKAPNSFVVMDLMRLPLGILSGMGFIGGGAILRKGDMVLGVTTAATLWFVTVVGLCLGGGQLGLGLVSLAVGILVLWLLKWVENLMPKDHRATFSLTDNSGADREAEIRRQLLAAGLEITNCAVTYAPQAQSRELRCQVQWRNRESSARPPAFLEQLAQQPGVVTLQWEPSA